MVKGLKIYSRILKQLGLFAGLCVAYSHSAVAQLTLPVQLDLKSAPVVRNLQNSLYSVWTEPLNDSLDWVMLKRFDGNTWYRLPGFLIEKGGALSDIALYKDRLFVSGSFVLRSNKRHNCVAMLNGRQWEGLGVFANQSSDPALVACMGVQEGKLYMGGRFIKFNTTEVNHLVTWNGSGVAPVGQPVFGANGMVLSLLPLGAEMLVSGNFTRLTGNTVNGLAAIRGQNANAVQSPLKTALRIFPAVNGYLLSGIDSFGKKMLVRMNGGSEILRNGMDSFTRIDAVVEWMGGITVFGACRINGRQAVEPVVHFRSGKWMADPGLLRRHIITRACRFKSELIIAGPALNIEGQNRDGGVLRIVPDQVYVRGKVFHDANNNGRQDIGERGLPGIFVSAGIAAGTLSNIEGKYDILLPTGRNYTLQVQNKRGWNSSAAFNLTLNDTQRLYEVNFPMQPLNSGMRDLSVRIVPEQGLTPRMDAAESYLIVVENQGLDMADGTLNLNFNNRVINTEVIPPPDFINNGRFTWNIRNLPAGESRQFLMVTRFPSSEFSESEAVSFHAQVSLSGGSDDFPVDNADSLPQTLSSGVKSPAEKLQIPAPENGDSMAYLPNNDNEIFYIIRFENTGTDTAYQVTVVDTVDISLMIAYIQETGASHSFTREMILDPNLPGKAVFVYTFNNIKLPQNSSANPEVATSRGFFGFKIGLKSGNSAGTVIRNRAGVYFDFDPPMLTNSVMCMLTEPSSIYRHESMSGAIQVYPNPAQDQFVVLAATGLREVPMLYDVSGRRLNLPAEKMERGYSFRTAGLKPGTYYLQCKINGALTTQKIIINP